MESNEGFEEMQNKDTAKSNGDEASLPQLLVVDDDENILSQVRWALSEDYEIHTTKDRAGALEIFRKKKMSVVLLDLGLPPHPREATEGLQALEEMISQNPGVKIIIVSGNSERQNALLAVEKGAHDIFPKPVDLDELKIVLGRVFRIVQLEKESRRERELTHRASFEQIIGSSPAMKGVFSSIRKVSGTDVPVLILGESGTGKELVANAVHNLGARQSRPFVAINCSAIPETLIESELFGHEKGSFTGAVSRREGKFESANGGTLFLDEIGDLAPELQVKLLRFLQEKVIERVGGRKSISVDARIIAATNQDLEDAVRSGRFREDLYFRLAVVTITLPPLRDRNDDVVELAQSLVDSYRRNLRKPPVRFTKAALDAMRQYKWPGNVRELQNRVQRALVLSDGRVIGPGELELPVPDTDDGEQATLKKAKEVLEREIISKALQENGGNISKTARALGISRPTLYQLIERHDLR